MTAEHPQAARVLGAMAVALCLTLLGAALWLDVGLPFPEAGSEGERAPWPAIPMLTKFDGYPSDELHPLDTRLRHSIELSLGVAFAFGVAAALATRRRALAGAVTAIVVAVGVVGAAVWEVVVNWWLTDCEGRSNCYFPSGYLTDLGVHTTEHSDR